MPLLSIAENIFLGNETARGGVIDWFAAYAQHARAAGQGRAEGAARPRSITNLGVGKQQLVEIAKALSKEVKLLILDEPTASLNESDSDALLSLLLELKAQGISSILISHKLNEIAKVADSITVLRDGATVETMDCRAGADQRGPHHPRHGRARHGAPLSAAHAADRRDHLRGARLARAPCAARRPRADQGRRTCTCGAARSSASRA